jgi:Raf kinase inhibitor-like YbhB/YbcL family protein
MRRTRIALGLLLVLTISCMNSNGDDQAAVSRPSGRMTISSPVFVSRGTIPQKYTCNGLNVSPPLAFGNVPRTARSLALEVTDPDAPGGTFTHWLVWNLPAAVTQIRVNDVPAGAIQGLNGFGASKYGGPCPPGGIHHYIFDLYALDTTLGLPSSKGRADFENAMKGHIIAKARIIGLYGK